MVAYAIGAQGEFITQHTGYFVLILILFGFSFIGYSYLFSFIFQKSTTAFRFFPFINLIFFYLLPLIPSIVASEGILAQYIMPFFTPFVALSAFFNSEQIVGTLYVLNTKPTKMIVSILALCFQTLVYAVTVIKLENLRFSLKTTADERFQQQQYENQIRE